MRFNPRLSQRKAKKEGSGKRKAVSHQLSINDGSIPVDDQPAGNISSLIICLFACDIHHFILFLDEDGKVIFCDSSLMPIDVFPSHVSLRKCFHDDLQ